MLLSSLIFFFFFFFFLLKDKNTSMDALGTSPNENGVSREENCTESNVTKLITSVVT